MENERELPECPICLQVYDEEEVIPRVLSCGHSACSPCIALLASSSSARLFADAIRCPSCNQVVHYPSFQGPSALPKNIDLLRLCSSSSSSRNRVDPRPTEPKRVEFLPLPWNDPFWGIWKRWIVPDDAISAAEAVVLGNSEFKSFSATLGKTHTCDLNFSFRENQTVRLLPVGNYISEQDESAKFKLSYPARVMEALKKFTEKEMDELQLILSAPSRQRRGLCRFLGLWMSAEKNSPLFLVSEAFQSDLSLLINSVGLINPEDITGITKFGLDLCEAVFGLHSQGVACGFLTLSCFRFDSYGHLSLDLCELLIECKRVRMEAAEGVRTSSWYFLSPELRQELRHDKPDVSPSNGLGYGSDVWSLACILVLLLVEDGSHHMLWDDSVELSHESYDIWAKSLISTLRRSLNGTRFEILMPILESCFSYDVESRPGVNELWKSLMALFIKSKYAVPDDLDTQSAENLSCCLVFANLCRSPIDERNITEEANINKDDLSGLSAPASSDSGADHFLKGKDSQYFGKSFDGGKLRSVLLKGHQDSVTGLAQGGGFIFSCSFDKTVRVWSLEDFSHVRTLRGPEQRVTAVVVVNPVGKPAMCVAGYRTGELSAWDVSTPAEQEHPLKVWRHHGDWRYTGIHSLATSPDFLYSGGGDNCIKAWSLKDLSLVRTLEGHRMTVSCLATSEGILYSGSWDGTIRLWWLHDHTPLAVLQQEVQDTSLSLRSPVLSLSTSGSLLAASYDTGFVKVWKEGVLMKSSKVLDGPIFSVTMDGRWIFAGGWDSSVLVQQLFSDSNSGVAELRPVGSLAFDSGVTSILLCRGMLFVASNTDIKMFRSNDSGANESIFN